MNATRSAPALAALLLLGACASLNRTWDQCEKANPNFIQLADCTIQEVHGEVGRTIQPVLRLRSESRAKRYSVKAEELIEKVGTGQVQDQDARVELRRALDDLLDEERDDRLSPLRQPAKTGITCSPAGTSVSCTAN